MKLLAFIFEQPSYAKTHPEMRAQFIHRIFHTRMYQTLIIDNVDLGNVQAVLLASD